MRKETFLNIISFMSAMVLIGLRPPPQNTIQEDEKRREKWNEAHHNDGRGPSGNFTALIDTISKEALANREEERREDRGKRFREYLTLLIVAITAGGILYQACIFSGQLSEMRSASIQTNKIIKANSILAEAARKQAAAAEQQATTLRDQLAKSEKEDRPNLFITIPYDISLHRFMHADPAFGSLDLKYRITNYGKFPAVIMSKNCVPAITDGLPSKTIFDNELFRFGQSNNETDDPIVIEAGKTAEFSCVPMFKNVVGARTIIPETAPDRVKLAAEKRLWILAVADYTDLPGRPHRYATCRQIRITGVGLFTEPSCTYGD